MLDSIIIALVLTIVILLFGGLYYLRNASKSWLWTIFVILIIPNATQINQNPGLEDILNVFSILALIFAIRRTFFVKTLPQKKENLTTGRRLKVIGILLFGSIALLVLIGFLSSVERSNDNNEWQAILEESKTATEYVAKKVKENKSCFEDNEISDEIKKATDCTTGIKGIVNKIESHATNVARMEEYYKSNKNNLEEDQRNLFENILKLYNSSEFKNLVSIELNYFNAHIKYYEFLRTNVGNKKLDEVSETESKSLTSIIESIENLTQELDAQKTSFNSYVKKNYNQEFIDLFYSKNPELMNLNNDDKNN